MFRAGLVSRSALIKGVYAQIVYLLLGADEKKLDRLKNGMLALSKGWEREHVEAVVREALIELIDPFIYQEALDLMDRSEEHTSELQSHSDLVCRLLLEKKK